MKIKPIDGGFEASLGDTKATASTKRGAKKNLARELQRRKNLPPVETRCENPGGGPAKTIWDEGAENSTEPLLICAPSFLDIQRMAGYPVDREGYAVVTDEDRDAIDWLRGAESEPYSAEEVEARHREAVNYDE